MRKIALVILDLIMPEMGGEQCLEEILKINPKAKILISTGYSSSDETTRITIEALASGFIAKPFALSDMLKTVPEILDRELYSPKIIQGLLVPPLSSASPFREFSW